MCARGKLDVKGTKDLHFFLRGVPSTVSSSGGSRVPARHVRAGATGQLACPKRVI